MVIISPVRSIKNIQADKKHFKNKPLILNSFITRLRKVQSTCDWRPVSGMARTDLVVPQSEAFKRK